MSNAIQSGTTRTPVAKRAFSAKVGEIPSTTRADFKAFTSIELLVVLGVIAILAAMTLMGLTQAKQRAQGAYCLNNQKQLVLAWKMYADDNSGKLVPNHDGTGVDLSTSWVVGYLSGDDGNRDNTNTQYLMTTRFGPYIRSFSIYKCPGDIYPCTFDGRTVSLPRVRSVSMNGFIEGGAYGSSSSGLSTWYGSSGWLAYNKLTDIIKPAPADLFVFVDEHADSINDGWMMTVVTNANNWEDLPASYHNGACGISFADGRAEMHKWLESTTKAPVQYLPSAPLPNGVAWPAPGSRDAPWMIQHASAQNR
jgi:prepilin-type processing-associated H-X9-DG protein